MLCSTAQMSIGVGGLACQGIHNCSYLTRHWSRLGTRGWRWQVPVCMGIHRVRRKSGQLTLAQEAPGWRRQRERGLSRWARQSESAELGA